MSEKEKPSFNEIPLWHAIWCTFHVSISNLKQTRCLNDISVVPDVKRLCGSGVMGQSELPRGEVGKGGRPAGRGLGCLKLLLSEKSDWDSAAAPSKGERAVMSDTLMGTTRLGLVKPGGGEGESLVGIWTERGDKPLTCDYRPKNASVGNWRKKRELRSLYLF